MESPNHHFHPLYIKIYDISKDIPLPKNSFQLFKNDETIEETMLCKTEKINIENESRSKPLKSIKFTVSTNVYKYRCSRKERVFIPPKATVKGTTGEFVADKVEQNDFISLSNYHCKEYDASIKKNTRYVNIYGDKNTRKRDYSKVDDKPAIVTYLPLKVKRLQGNNNRVKATKVATKYKKK